MNARITHSLVLLATAGFGGLPAAAQQRKPPARPAKVPAQPAPKTPQPTRPAPQPVKPPAPTSAAVAPPSGPGELVRGPIDVVALQRARRVRVSHSGQMGSPDLVFDGNRHTFATAPAGPAFLQVVLDRPRLVDEVNVSFTSSGPHQWTLLAADNETDMTARQGSFRQLFPLRVPQFEGEDQVTFPAPKPYRVYRLEYRRTTGERGPELAEWSLWTPQPLAAIQVETFVPSVMVGEKVQLRADAAYEAGARQNLTPEVQWEVVPPSAGVVDELSRFEGKIPGPARIFAVLSGRRSEPLAVEVLAQGQPDWTVTYIERQPRLHLAETGAELQPGQKVLWFAHVRNYGTRNAEPVEVEWRLDGKVIRSGSLPKIERFAQTEIIVTLPWDGLPHDLEFVVDPRGQAPELSKTNNRLSVRTDALGVGFWVEDSALRYFHRYQKELGIGSNSFEDWAQRQVQYWNRWMENSAWLHTDRRLAARRFRVDRIIVVGDGMLPMAGGSPRLEPDRRDDTVHVTVGVPASDAARAALYGSTSEKGWENPFYHQVSLLGMLGRVRYTTRAEAKATAPPAGAASPPAGVVPGASTAPAAIPAAPAATPPAAPATPPAAPATPPTDPATPPVPPVPPPAAPTPAPAAPTPAPTAPAPAPTAPAPAPPAPAPAPPAPIAPPAGSFALSRS